MKRKYKLLGLDNSNGGLKAIINIIMKELNEKDSKDK